jgi:hypothetical protein
MVVSTLEVEVVERVDGPMMVMVMVEMGVKEL